MAIILDDSIRVGQQKPTDDRKYNNLTPYTSVAQANSLLPLAVRYDGLTIIINSVEYWYHLGTEDSNLIIKSGGGTVIPIENIGVWSPLSGYTAGNTYVSYVNTGSSDTQFQTEAIYRCDVDTTTGESPETNPEKWVYNGQNIDIVTDNTSKVYISGSDPYGQLKSIVGYTHGDNEVLSDNNVVMTFNEYAITGATYNPLTNTYPTIIKPYDWSGTTGGWVEQCSPTKKQIYFSNAIDIRANALRPAVGDDIIDKSTGYILKYTLGTYIDNGTTIIVPTNKLLNTPGAFIMYSYTGTVYKNIYVDVSATAGSNNGTSWANAFLTLDLAFSGISDYTNVWVMGGTYIFKSLITVTANNINVRGINTYAGVTPLLKSNTTTYVDLFRFSGNNILFDNFKITDKVATSHLTFGGTSTVQANNYTVSNIYFFDINVDTNKDPITGTVIGSYCMRLNYADNSTVDNIRINDVCTASGGISNGACNNVRFNNININNFSHSASNGVALTATAVRNGFINNIRITNCNLLRSRFLRPLMFSTAATYGSNLVVNNVIVDNCWIRETVLYVGIPAQLQSVIVSNMIVKNCSTTPGYSGIFAIYSIAGSTLTLVNCTTLYNNLSTIWQVDNFSNLKAIGCIFQEPTLLALITTTTRVELISCLLTPALTHNAVVTDCIVGPAEFVSISDLRLKSISLGIDDVPVTLVAPYLKYPEQWYDSNNKRFASSWLSMGACQDLEYVTEPLTPLGERGQSEVDVMSQKGVDDAFIALEEWIDINLTQPIGQMASSQTVSDLQDTMESTTTYNDEQFAQLNQKITDDVANAWNALNGVDVQIREDFSMLVYDLDQVNSRGFAKMSDIADAKAYADSADGLLQQSIYNVGVAQQTNAEDISNLSLGVSAMSDKLDDTYSAVEAQGVSIDEIQTDVSALKTSAQSNTSLAEAVQGNTNSIVLLWETCYNIRQQAESDRNVVGDLLNFVYCEDRQENGYGKTIIDCYPNQFLTLLERDGVTEICFKRPLINQSDPGLVQKEYRVVVGLLQGGSLSFNFNDLPSEPLACATNPPTFEAGKFYAVELNSSFLRVTELVAI